MTRAERRREQRRNDKKTVTRTMTIAQIQQLKHDMSVLIADEMLMKVFGIATLVIHDKFGTLMRKEVDGIGREERFIDECMKLHEAFENGYLTLEDIQETLTEECGLTLKIKNDRKREWM